MSPTPLPSNGTEPVSPARNEKASPAPEPPRARKEIFPLVLALLPLLALLLLVTHDSSSAVTTEGGAQWTIAPGSPVPGVYRPTDPPSEGTGERQP
jgi:hypothetical protein